MSDTVEESIVLHGFPPNIQQRFIDELHENLTDKVGANFKARGYGVKDENSQPLRKKKEVPPYYQGLRAYKVTFAKGSEFGTSVELTWKEKELDMLKLKFEEDPPRKTTIIAFTSALFMVLLYGLTVYFWEFWVVTIASGLICCLLPILIAIAPGVGGLVIGVLLGGTLYKATVKPEVAEHNRKELEHVHREVMTHANALVTGYRQRMNEMTQQHQGPYNRF